MRGMKKWLPFKSLKGQDEVLERKAGERTKVERPVLSSDMEEELDHVLHSLRRGDRAAITFFHDGEILSREDVFDRTDALERRVYFFGFSLTLGSLLGLRKVG